MQCVDDTVAVGFCVYTALSCRWTIKNEAAARSTRHSNVMWFEAARMQPFMIQVGSNEVISQVVRTEVLREAFRSRYWQSPD